VTTQGGGIGALNLNAAEKLVIFGRGDPAGGTVNVNEPTQVAGPGQLDEVFGADTRINEAMRDAAGNGTAFSVMFGVVPEEVSVTAEAIAGGSGTLDNIPIEDESLIDIQNTTAGQSESVVFRYENPIDTSGLASGEVAIDPSSGAVAAGDTDDYEIDYAYHEWQAAFDSAVDVIEPQEAGQWCVLSDSESVVSDAVASVSPLRENQHEIPILKRSLPLRAPQGIGDSVESLESLFRCLLRHRREAPPTPLPIPLPLQVHTQTFDLHCLHS